MLRDSTEGEARARYTTGIVCGPMLLLSDDYRREDVCARTEKIAGNERVNALARLALEFRPLTKTLYAAVRGSEIFLAVFGISEQAEKIRVSPKEYSLPEGTWCDQWTGKQYTTVGSVFEIAFEGTDAAILKWEKS